MNHAARTVAAHYWGLVQALSSDTVAYLSIGICMHKIIAIGMSSVLLAGCSLPSALSPSAPTESETSEKTPEEYASCVHAKWKVADPKTQVLKTSNGFRLTISSSLKANDVLEVSKNKTGSKVFFYEGSPLHIAKSAIKNAVRECL